MSRFMKKAERQHFNDRNHLESVVHPTEKTNATADILPLFSGAVGVRDS